MQQADSLFPSFWVWVLFGIALVEAQGILRGWSVDKDEQFDKYGVAYLKDNYVNGDLGFDPFGFKQVFDQDDMKLKELNNGRYPFSSSYH